MKPLVKVEKSFPITIHIAGRYPVAEKILKKYCDEVGFCVTLKMVEYIYKGGTEHGIQVGLINYPRFPSDPATLTAKAIEIAELLREGMKQESFSVETPVETIWYSYRKGDVTND
jgi:hypothetical protein